MTRQDGPLTSDRIDPTDTPQEGENPAKGVWQEPKLTFVEPELTQHGSITELTAEDPGFFGTFTP